MAGPGSDTHEIIYLAHVLFVVPVTIDGGEQWAREDARIFRGERLLEIWC